MPDLRSAEVGRADVALLIVDATVDLLAKADSVLGPTDFLSPQYQAAAEAVDQARLALLAARRAVWEAM